ncbi:MAG TPA: VCBS repeat-containing protein [Enhygromyxa sp.]|nr:VCBS repeat-containing protein [Enhygromyxa sp.]
MRRRAPSQHGIASALGWLLLGCSPARIGADSGSSSSESEGSGSSEVVDETDVDSGDGDGEADWDGDTDTSEDPCEQVDCELCVGGLCVEPAPLEPCAELVLTEIDDGVELTDSHLGPVLLLDLDGIPGDERIVAADNSLEVVISGQLVVSDLLPPGQVINLLTPLQIDPDGRVDLIIRAYDMDIYEGAIVFLRGDGAGGFTPEPERFVARGSEQAFVPVDFDNDGDHDLLSSMSWSATTTELRTNQAGVFTLTDQFELSGRFGRAVDLDLDGFVDDALYFGDPSPLTLIGKVGGMVAGAPLPAAQQAPALEYEAEAPVAADLDGDGYVEILAALADNQFRYGVRVWWGSATGFDDPRDQWLPAPYGDLEQLEIVELDGVAPPELLIRWDSRDNDFVFARPDLANHLPFGCLGVLDAYSNVDASIGDVDADGQPELAVRYADGPQLFTIMTP